MNKPVVTIDKDVITVALDVQREDGVEGAIVGRFLSPVYAKNDIEATLQCVVIFPTADTLTFESRINCLSNSSKESYARQLTLAFGKEIKWVLILSKICSTFVTVFRDSLTNEAITCNEIEAKDTLFLLSPFLEEGSPNIIFGKGGSGKTFLAMRMAMSVVCGASFLGENPTKPTAVLFLDYESTASTFSSRVDQMMAFCVGFEKTDKAGLVYLNSKGMPLHEIKETLLKIIEKYNIGLLIVDSAALACGGSPEDAQSAIRYFNTLNSLGITTLTIAHETKAENHAYVFGSVFFHNSARNIWNVKTDREQEENCIHAGLIHRKSNNDRVRSPFGACITFHESGIEIVQENPLHIENERGIKPRILEVLKLGSKSVEELTDELGVEAKDIRSRLSEMKKEGKVSNPLRGVWERNKGNIIEISSIKAKKNDVTDDKKNTGKIDDYEW